MAKANSISQPEGLPEFQFGLRWKPGHDNEFLRRRFCALNGLGTTPTWEHRKWMVQYIWTDDQFAWNYWTERQIKGLCKSRWVTWWGPGGCGKTTSAAAFALEWWLECPMKTAVIVCSTSIKMLRKRIWNQVAQLHQQIDKRRFDHHGELIDSDTMIRWEAGDNKNGIFGLAVEDGPVEQIIQNLIGIHTERVWLILDEMQGVREAIIRATRNMAKNPWFQMLGMGNPESWEDTLGKQSEPLVGRDNIDPMVDEEWETHGGPVKGNGLCQIFIGPKSPAVLDPEWGRRHTWMINQEQMDADLKAAHGNVNDPEYLSQTIGIIPVIGLVSTILDAAIVSTFQVKAKAVWTDGFRYWASLDPSFEGGDRKVLKIGRFGKVSDPLGARWVIATDQTIDVPIDSKSSRPIHYQIVDFVKAKLIPMGIPPEQFALDSTGEGGGLMAIFEQEWGAVVGVEFGGAASDRPIHDNARPGIDGKVKTCNEAYSNRMTELHMLVREFAMNNGIRQLTDQSVKEFCARKTFFKNKRIQVEPKGTRIVDGKKEKGFKARFGCSPDDSDCQAIGVELCRQLGATPSLAGAISEESQRNRWNDIVEEADRDFDPDGMLETPTYQAYGL